MKRVIRDCDVCGGSGALEVTVCVDRRMSPSGNGYETVMESVDLCPECLVKELVGFVESRNVSPSEWVAQVRQVCANRQASLEEG